MLITIDQTFIEPPTSQNKQRQKILCDWMSTNGVNPLAVGFPTVIDTDARTITCPLAQEVDGDKVVTGDVWPVQGHVFPTGLSVITTVPMIVDPPAVIAEADHAEHRCGCGATWPKGDANG